MIGFEHPDVFLLGAVLVLWLRGRLWPRPLVGLLRIGALLAILGMLAGPFVTGEASGRDLVLLVDRSRSVPDETLARAEELAALALEQARAGDRVGMIGFGREAVVEIAPTEEFRYRAPVRTVDRDATDLASALDAGLSLIPPGRQGSLLVLSDGEYTGGDPSAAARAALRRGIRVDVVGVRRAAGMDVAVEEVATPEEVGPGEPFQFSAWLRADRAAEARVRLLRDGVPIAEGRRALQPGLNRVQFRDALREPRVHRYEVEVVPDEGDPRPQNNRARAVVRVAGAFRVLCVTPRGRQDRLTRALAQAGIAVQVAAPRTAPLSLDALDGVRAVVLENVAAADLPAGGMRALAHWVRELGGGLLMTGGGASFGPGGYFRSPIEEALPVTMEVRQEQRKFALAMAIALDRSGSMGMTVPSGETKMDLANQGTAAAIGLLGPIDHVAVIAVDSSPHVVVPCTSARQAGRIQDDVLGIESGGGGIYTYTALVAAAEQLADAPQANKHIVLFADAADAEEPGDYIAFIEQLRRAGVTVSVIGLGSDTDSDAAFLEDVAKRGGGRCSFVTDAADLPRVFAQETIQVARSSMVEEATAVQVLPDLVALGDLARGEFPNVGGYSIAYRRPAAQVGLRTADDQQAPLLAFWQHGLGRSAAFLGEVDGELSGSLGTWPGFAGFFATVVRWIAGTDARGELFAALRREGHEAVLSVEVDEGRAALLGEVSARVLGPDGEAETVWLQRVDEHRLEGRIPLRGEGVYRPALTMGGGEVLRVPPVTLPYSPEFELQRDPRRGERVLAEIAALAEGRVDPPAAALMAGPRRSAGVTRLDRWCAWLALVLLLAEIAVRRLQLSLPRVAVLRPRPRTAARPTRAESGRPEVKEGTSAALEPGVLAPDAGGASGAGDVGQRADLASVLERAKSRAKR